MHEAALLGRNMFGRREHMSHASRTFLWHRYLTESTNDMGLMYRAFLAACQAGPIVVDVVATIAQLCIGTSELVEADNDERQ